VLLECFPQLLRVPIKHTRERGCAVRSWPRRRSCGGTSQSVGERDYRINRGSDLGCGSRSMLGKCISGLGGDQGGQEIFQPLVLCPVKIDEDDRNEKKL